MKDNTKKVSKNREIKEKIVAELIEKVGRAKALVFSNYQGMTHRQIEGLKKSLKKSNAELVIAKNTLLRRALAEKDHKIEDFALQNPTLTMFAYDDPTSPLKEITKSFKAIALPKIKFGIFEGSILAENDVIRLSTLPSREVLLAQFVGSLKSPIYGLYRALNWNLQKFVLTLNAVQQTKTQG